MEHISWDVLLRQSIHFFTIQIVMHRYYTGNPILLYISDPFVFFKIKVHGTGWAKVLVVSNENWPWLVWHLLKGYGDLLIEPQTEAMTKSKLQSRSVWLPRLPEAPGSGPALPTLLALDTAAVPDQQQLSPIPRKDSLRPLFLYILSSQRGAWECAWVVRARSRACLRAREILEEQVNVAPSRGGRWWNPLTREAVSLQTMINAQQRVRRSEETCLVQRNNRCDPKSRTMTWRLFTTEHREHMDFPVLLSISQSPVKPV